MNEASDSKFLARKWNVASDESDANYDVGNEIMYNTVVLKSNLCDYNDAYILVMVDITVVQFTVTLLLIGNARVAQAAFKIDGITINDAEELGLVMPIYNLIEFNSNYSDTTGSSCFFSKNEVTDFHNDVANTVIFKSQV